MSSAGVRYRRTGAVMIGIGDSCCVVGRWHPGMTGLNTQHDGPTQPPAFTHKPNITPMIVFFLFYLYSSCYYASSNHAGCSSARPSLAGTYARLFYACCHAAGVVVFSTFHKSGTCLPDRHAVRPAEPPQDFSQAVQLAGAAKRHILAQQPLRNERASSPVASAKNLAALIACHHQRQARAPKRAFAINPSPSTSCTKNLNPVAPEKRNRYARNSLGPCPESRIGAVHTSGRRPGRAPHQARLSCQWCRQCHRCARRRRASGAGRRRSQSHEIGRAHV